jgi:hypothetical protein
MTKTVERSRRRITTIENIPGEIRADSGFERYKPGIKEHDQPREIIVDLSHSIYREIHNLFNPPGKIGDCVARVKKIDRSANTRTRCRGCGVIVRKE